jgi:hypothetical protein
MSGTASKVVRIELEERTRVRRGKSGIESGQTREGGMREISMTLKMGELGHGTQGPTIEVRVGWRQIISQ